MSMGQYEGWVQAWRAVKARTFSRSTRGLSACSRRSATLPGRHTAEQEPRKQSCREASKWGVDQKRTEARGTKAPHATMPLKIDAGRGRFRSVPLPICWAHRAALGPTSIGHSHGAPATRRRRGEKPPSPIASPSIVLRSSAALRAPSCTRPWSRRWGRKRGARGVLRAMHSASDTGFRSKFLGPIVNVIGVPQGYRTTV